MSNIKSAETYATADNADYKTYGKELLQSALLGAGGTGTLLAMRQLAQGLRPRQLPRSKRPKPYADEGKAAAHSDYAAKLMEFLQNAGNTAGSKMQEFGNTVGSKMQDLGNRGLEAAGKAAVLPAFLGGDSKAMSPGMVSRGWRNAANATAALAGAGGTAYAMNHMASKKRQTDLEDAVEDARNEYMAALTGKAAAALDAAYDVIMAEKAAAGSWEDAARSATGPGTMYDSAAKGWESFKDNAKGLGSHTITGLLLSSLGAGGIGAKYMYDRTKARSESESLLKAQASRARMRAMQEAPWIDPEELVGLSGRAHNG